MKKILYILLMAFFFVSCTGKDSDEPDYKKEVLASVKNEDEREAIENIANHKDKGVYKYITYNLKDDSVVRELLLGKSDDRIFNIINDNDYFFNDGKTITYANKKKNLYYQESTDTINNQMDTEGFYQDLYNAGLSKIDIEDDYISLYYKDDSYSKYDAQSLDLVEDKFKGEGNELIKKLESKDKDVKAAYDGEIKVIEGMKKAKSVGEVTGNE